MNISEDRISDLAHRVLKALRTAGNVDIPSDARALQGIKESLTRFFSVDEEIDAAVRSKLRGKVPGSREYDILYQKYHREEMDRRKW